MISDWDDAYANSAHIRGGDSYPAAWQGKAAGFRTEMQAAGRTKLDIPHGSGERQRFDSFLPDGEAKGVFIFIHGGYWLRFDRTSFSHLAAGAVQHGWYVAMPSYTLAPEKSVAGITQELASAVAHIASNVEGPIVLAGHSAGGHLASRMVCRDIALPETVRSRIRHVISVSGLHDLRPLLRTAMSEKLFRTPTEAAAESPALLEPYGGVSVTCWVGSDERPEFVRQSDLLANIWSGMGADMHLYHAEGRHHFDVIDALADPDSELMRLLPGYSR